MKLKAMEKVYLSRIETNQEVSKQESASGAKKAKPLPEKKGGPRELQDRFVDDPDYVRRGQQWDFDVKKSPGGEGGSSSKKK